MTLHSMNCPKCGGKIEMDLTGKKFIFCPFCGEQIAVVDENVKTININKTIKQETINHDRLAEIEFKEREQKRESRDGWIALIILLALMAACFGGVQYSIHLDEVKYIQDENERKNHIKTAEEQGLICAGIPNNYIGDNYKEVKRRFEDMGFTNVKTQALGDTIAVWNWGEVVSVSINGRTKFNYSDYFKPDDPVLISFH